MKTIDPTNSSFEKLITSRNVYVDKTDYIYDLVNGGGTFFPFQISSFRQVPDDFNA